jgi:glycosyltransferase involved in cell wall biosynthesis
MPSFAIVANGFADGPAQALRDHLVARGADVVTVLHPLTREQGTRHFVTTYAGGRELHVRTTDVRLRPPLSFAADTAIPLRLPRVDVWLGFNPLACARGLLQRRLGRASKVVLWSVDFAPDRFGHGTMLTRVYNRLDRWCCLHADARVELSEAAREARERHHGIGPGTGAPAIVVPMGAWLERTPVVPPDGYERRQVVFLGHLVPRQGVGRLLEALALLSRRDPNVGADIVGSGPDEQLLRERAHALGLDGIVEFHGYVPDHREVERLLAAGSVAAAPYDDAGTSFTRHADPGKLKAYLAAGLPIVVTDVPPNARELAESAGAEVVAYDAEALADAIERALAPPEEWRERRERALAYARRFDWPVLLDDALEKLGVRVD